MKKALFLLIGALVEDLHSSGARHVALSGAQSRPTFVQFGHLSRALLLNRHRLHARLSEQLVFLLLEFIGHNESERINYELSHLYSIILSECHLLLLKFVQSIVIYSYISLCCSAEGSSRLSTWSFIAVVYFKNL